MKKKTSGRRIDVNVDELDRIIDAAIFLESLNACLVHGTLVFPSANSAL